MTLTTRPRIPFLYSFNVSGRIFYLSYRNLWSDGPNRLTSLVRRYPKRRHFVLDTNPDVFVLIHRHLQGYTVRACEGNLDLLKDAQWYGLKTLEISCLGNNDESTEVAEDDASSTLTYLYSQCENGSDDDDNSDDDDDAITKESEQSVQGGVGELTNIQFFDSDFDFDMSERIDIPSYPCQDQYQQPWW